MAARSHGPGVLLARQSGDACASRQIGAAKCIGLPAIDSTISFEYFRFGSDDTIAVHNEV
jgi:hypothetical protein